MRELRLAQLALDGAHPLSLVTQSPLGLFEARQDGIHRLLQQTNLLAFFFDGLVGHEQTFVLAFFFGRHFSQIGIDLPLPLTEALQGLRQFQRLYLNGVSLLLQIVEMLARLLQGITGIVHARLDFGHTGMFLVDTLFAPLDQHPEFLNFALPLKQPVFSRIRRKQGQALPTDHIAAGSHAAGLTGQGFAKRQSRGQIGDGINFTEPLVENSHKLRIVTTNMNHQAISANAGNRVVRRRLSRKQQGQFAARPILAPCRIGQFRRQCAQTFAQHGFHRIFPASLDMQ